MYSYTRSEKLKIAKDIACLFEGKNWLSCGKLRIITVENNRDSDNSVVGNKIGFSVSKRLFKRAVDRNRIKRLLRESYRLNKTIFSDAFGNSNLAMLFWVHKEKPKDFYEVQKEFLRLCEKRRKK